MNIITFIGRLFFRKIRQQLTLINIETYIVIILIGYLFILNISFGFTIDYYVDFENGDDSNNGTSTSSAWKHAPGDDHATNVPGTISLKGGDRVLFKGGTIYRGEIRIKHDGTTENSLIYKGNAWGSENAILDGSLKIESNWTQCQSSDECFGNSHFKNIYYTTAPADFDFFNGFYEDNRFLWYSQDPNPVQPFEHDRIDSFRKIPFESTTIVQTKTSLRDNEYFNQSQEDFWDGAYIISWVIPNVTTIKPITRFYPITHTIEYDSISNDLYKDRDSYYAVLNHTSLIDRPGEYCFNTKENKIYLWPLDSDNPNLHTFSVRDLHTAITFSSRKNLVIEGFTVKNYIMGIRSTRTETENVVIRNNEVINLKCNNWYAIQLTGNNLVCEKNQVTNCIRGVGILAGGGSHNIIIRDNYVSRTSRQGIWVMGVTYGLVVDNIVEDIQGTHSNAISFYLRNRDILAAGNKIYNCNSDFTYHGDHNSDWRTNLVVYNNYFQNAAHSWGKDMIGVTIINNVFGGGCFSNDSDTDMYLINNIIHGGGSADIIRSHNIYTDLSWFQAERYGWMLKEGEIDWSEKDIALIFEDISNDKEGYKLAQNSPAIDAGINPLPYLQTDLFKEYDFTKDIDGNPRPQGINWDMGVSEINWTPVNNSMIHEAPLKFTLSHNYPNPFNSITQLHYQLPSDSYVKITIYNTMGQLVNVIFKAHQKAGNHSISWKGINDLGSHVPSGLYFIELNAGMHHAVRKITLLK